VECRTPLPWRLAFERFRNGSDVLRGVPAATTGYVDESVFRKTSQETSHVGRAEIEAGFGKRIW
jgi:hypothetical protein